jgi:hypothetical protein
LVPRRIPSKTARNRNFPQRNWKVEFILDAFKPNREEVWRMCSWKSTLPSAEIGSDDVNQLLKADNLADHESPRNNSTLEV